MEAKLDGCTGLLYYFRQHHRTSRDLHPQVHHVKTWRYKWTKRTRGIIIR